MVSDIPAGTGKSVSFFTVYIFGHGPFVFREFSGVLIDMCWKGTGTMCYDQGRCVGKGHCVVFRDEVLVRDNVMWSGTMCW